MLEESQLHPASRRTHNGAVLAELSPAGSPPRLSSGRMHPWEGHTGSMGRDEGAAGTDHSFHPPFPCATLGKEVGEVDGIDVFQVCF